MKSDVFVAMCVYKGDSSLGFRDALDSMLLQSKKADVFVYIDGPVGKDVEEVVEQYSNTNSVKFISALENKGLAHGLNVLIDLAIEGKYKYFARMDSDDVSLSDRLELQIDFLEKNDHIDVLGGACKEFGSIYAKPLVVLPEKHEDLVQIAITRNCFIHPTVVLRVNCFKGGIRYPEDTILVEDLALWHLLLLNGFRFANLKDVVLNFKLDESTLKRRSGFKKGVYEFRVRFKFARAMKRASVLLIFLLLARFLMQLSPFVIYRTLYRYLR